MEKEQSEEKATEAHRINSDSEDKQKVKEEQEEYTKQKSDNNKKNEKENQHHSVSFLSPSLHSLSDSPVSDGHFSADHGALSPPPQRPTGADSSPVSTISDDHGERFAPVLPPVVTAHRFQVEPKVVVTKVDPGAEEGFVGVKDVEGGANGICDGSGGGNLRLRPDVSSLLRSKKVATLNKLLLGLRITAFVSCLVSFSVLAADKEQGWAQDSFYLYKEFRYSLSVNVIGFVYSGLQICDLVQYLINRKHIVEHPLRGYFSFALDQILTYLLMSASSSAATRAYDWESNWGKDKFPYMANASVALSFIAFAAFALASLVSGSFVCRFR